jgi:hypothetical protein
VTVTYEGLPSVPVTVWMKIVPPSSSGLPSQTKAAAPSPGPGSSRVGKTSALTFSFGQQLSTSSLQPSNMLTGDYSVFLYVTDGCMRSGSNGGSYTSSVQANGGSAVATFKVSCPYTASLTNVQLLNSTTLVYNQTIDSGSPPVLPEQYMMVQGQVFNCSQCNNGPVITGSEGNVWLMTSVFFTYSATTVSNPSSLSYSNTASYTFQNQDVSGGSSYVFKMYAAQRSLAVSQSSPTVPILSGQAGYAQFTASQANGKANMALPNSGGYKVMVMAYPRQGPCSVASSTQYFQVNCLSITAPVLVDATVASSPVVTYSPVLTFALFALVFALNGDQG